MQHKNNKVTLKNIGLTIEWNFILTIGEKDRQDLEMDQTCAIFQVTAFSPALWYGTRTKYHG